MKQRYEWILPPSSSNDLCPLFCLCPSISKAWFLHSSFSFNFKAKHFRPMLRGPLLPGSLSGGHLSQLLRPSPPSPLGMSQIALLSNCYRIGESIFIRNVWLPELVGGPSKILSYLSTIAFVWVFYVTEQQPTVKKAESQDIFFLSENCHWSTP